MEVSYTITFETEISLTKSLTQYVIYEVKIFNDENVSKTVNVMLILPKYHKIVSISPSHYVKNSNNVSWVLTISPKMEKIIQVKVLNFIVSNPVIDLDYNLKVNGINVESSIVNASLNSNLTLLIKVRNKLPIPIPVSIVLTQDEGLKYRFSLEPTTCQVIGNTKILTWVLNVEDSSKIWINSTIDNFGPWYSINLNPVIVSTLIDMSKLIQILENQLTNVNSILTMLKSLTQLSLSFTKSSENISQGVILLANELNRTSLTLQYIAYTLNQTQLIQHLIQFQIQQMYFNIIAIEKSMKIYESSVDTLMNTLKPIVNQAPQLVSTLNALKQYVYTIENETLRTTLMMTIDMLINYINMLVRFYKELENVKKSIASTYEVLDVAKKALKNASSTGLSPPTFPLKKSNICEADQSSLLISKFIIEGFFESRYNFTSNPYILKLTSSAMLRIKNPKRYSFRKIVSP